MNSENAENAAVCRDPKSRRTDSTPNPRKVRPRIPKSGKAQPQHSPAILAQLEACYVADRSAMEGRGRASGLYDPEDPVQDAYLSLLKANRLTSVTIRWRIKRHRCRCCTALTKQIARDQRVTPLTDGLAEVLDGNDSNFELSDVRDEVAMMLRRLSPSHRRVLELHYLEGLSIKDISKVTAESQSAIKTRLHRARLEACVALRRIRQISESPCDHKAGAPGWMCVAGSTRH